MGRMDKTILDVLSLHYTKLLICLIVTTAYATNATQIETGYVEEIGGINCYVNGPKYSKVSVLLASDIFGYEIPHLRQIADKVGAAGFYAVVPDFFNGDPYVSGRPERPYYDWVKLHPASEGIKTAKRVIEALKFNGITKIGGAGFCWGGKVVIDLTKLVDIRAAVLLHPSDITVDDIKDDHKVPISIFGGQNDTYIPPSIILQYEQVLKEKPEIDSFVKIVPGAGHGWTTRYNDTDPVAVARAEETHKDLLNWLTKYLLGPQEGFSRRLSRGGPSPSPF